MTNKSAHALVRSHVTAPTQFVTANGIRYAYRRFGAETGTPLIFLQHFRGGMDHWDPAVTDGLAANPSSHPVQQHGSRKLKRRDTKQGGSAVR